MKRAAPGSSNDSPATVVKREKLSVNIGPLKLAGPDGIYARCGCQNVTLEVELGADDAATGFRLSTDKNVSRFDVSDADDALELFIAACAARVCKDKDWNTCAISTDPHNPDSFFFRIMHSGPPESLIAKIPCTLANGYSLIPALEVMKHRRGVLLRALSMVKAGRAVDP